MSIKLKDSTVFVSGATSGFGEACACAFAREKARVIICGRREDRLSKLAKELGKLTRVHALVLDVRDREKIMGLIPPLPMGEGGERSEPGEGRGQIKNVAPKSSPPSLPLTSLGASPPKGEKSGVGPYENVRALKSTGMNAGATALPEEFAKVDILINNAGLAAGLDPAHKVSLDDWEQMVDTNIKGLMYLTRALLPGMVARNRGHIVNISSTASQWPYPGGNVYGGTKAFVEQFTLNLKADLLGTAVRVSDVAPGMSETEFSLVRFHGDAVAAKKVYQGFTPLSADDVAEAVMWCVTRPAHVNVNRVELMPVAQAWGHWNVDRRG